MEGLPVYTITGLIGLVLLLFGLFLLLTGLQIIEIKKISVSPGKRTWGIGILFAVIGIVMLIPETKGNVPTTLEINPTAEIAEVESESTTPPEPTLTIEPSTIPSPMPSQEPTPNPQASEYLFQDDFTRTNGVWDTYNGSLGEMDYYDGGYRFFVNDQNNGFWSVAYQNLTDVRIEVDASKINGPDSDSFGIICRYQDDYNWYYLMITSGGHYLIGKYKSGTHYSLDEDDWGFSSKINQGEAENHLRADCIGDKLSLYANGTLLAQATDVDFTEGDVGMLVNSYEIAGVDIKFDNFQVLDPLSVYSAEESNGETESDAIMASNDPLEIDNFIIQINGAYLGETYKSVDGTTSIIKGALTLTGGGFVPSNYQPGEKVLTLHISILSGDKEDFTELGFWITDQNGSQQEIGALLGVDDDIHMLFPVAEEPTSLFFELSSGEKINLERILEVK